MKQKQKQRWLPELETCSSKMGRRQRKDKHNALGVWRHRIADPEVRRKEKETAVCAVQKKIAKKEMLNERRIFQSNSSQ